MILHLLYVYYIQKISYAKLYLYEVPKLVERSCLSVRHPSAVSVFKTTERRGGGGLYEKLLGEFSFGSFQFSVMYTLYEPQSHYIILSVF
jgi:hypothetical protein